MRGSCVLRKIEGFPSCARKVVGSTGGCALADTAAKTPPGRQGLANITGQQCADRHHATRLLLRGASLWAVPRDIRQQTPPKNPCAIASNSLWKKESLDAVSQYHRACHFTIERKRERKKKRAINIFSNLDGSICVMFETSSRDAMHRFINLPVKLSAGNCSVLTFPRTVSPVQRESLRRDWDDCYSTGNLTAAKSCDPRRTRERFVFRTRVARNTDTRKIQLQVFI